MQRQHDFQSRFFDEAQYLANALAQVEAHLKHLASVWSGERARVGAAFRREFQSAGLIHLRGAIEHMAEHRAERESPQFSALSPNDDAGPEFRIDHGWPVSISLFGLLYPVQATCNAVVNVARAWGDPFRWPEPRDAAFYLIRRVVLASGSPRRRELLEALGVPFEVDISDVDETVEETDPVRVAEMLAERKARAVAARQPGAVVIGSDTVVALGGRLLGKPADAAEAHAMLSALRGRTHQVVTGVAVVRDGAASVAHASTDVTMRAYTEAEMAAFIATGSPFDKAGGYAIQDPDFAPVAQSEGCECAVVGLPLWTLRALLIEAGVHATEPALERCAGCPARG
ncbi:MAG: hypothetical protein AMXMBFR23_25370 [Chloroflexota bacterium]